MIIPYSFRRCSDLLSSLLALILHSPLPLPLPSNAICPHHCPWTVKTPQLNCSISVAYRIDGTGNNSNTMGKINVSKILHINTSSRPIPTISYAVTIKVLKCMISFSSCFLSSCSTIACSIGLDTHSRWMTAQMKRNTGTRWKKKEETFTVKDNLKIYARCSEIV